jgi:hypothetical protein
LVSADQRKDIIKTYGKRLDYMLNLLTILGSIVNIIGGIQVAFLWLNVNGL